LISTWKGGDEDWPRFVGVALLLLLLLLLIHPMLRKRLGADVAASILWALAAPSAFLATVALMTVKKLVLAHGRRFYELVIGLVEDLWFCGGLLRPWLDLSRSGRTHVPDEILVAFALVAFYLTFKWLGSPRTSASGTSSSVSPTTRGSRSGVVAGLNVYHEI